MKTLYIIKVGTTFPAVASRHGDFEDWTRKGLALTHTPVVVVDAPGGETLPDSEKCVGVVVTGSHDMVTDRLAWSVGIERWLPSVIGAGVPFLGICYGHQLLAQAMGGKVGYHPNGPEAGTVAIASLADGFDDPLFASLPDFFDAHAIHEQTVLELPPGGVRLACNAFEPNHAFRIGDRAWGVQFHPEYNESIMRAYLQDSADHLSSKQRDVFGLLETVRPTPDAARLLARFGRLVEKQALAGCA